MNRKEVDRLEATIEFIQLSFDLLPDHYELKHEIIRACPRGQTPKFFISHRGIPKISKAYPTVMLESPVIKEI